jgi:2'-deoxynucleoside 5'-phosphate N-hydrolase
MNTIKVYISGALKAAQDLESARTLYELTAACCESIGIQAHLPHKQTDPVHGAHVPPRDVFDRDVAALLSANVVVAHVGEPSLGVGAEIGLALAHGLRMILLWPQDTEISRFIRGMIEAYPEQIKSIPYASEADGLRDLVEVLSGVCASSNIGLAWGHACTGAGC